MKSPLPDEIGFACRDSIATITINRSEKLNTLTAAMGEALFSLCEEIDRNDDIKVVILTGAGEKAFSVGSDVSLLTQYGSNWQLRNRRDYAYAIRQLRKAVIAMVRGYCIGGGLELALMSDIRFAEPNAKFGASEIKLGWCAGAGNTQLLPRLLGYGNAAKMLLTGDVVDAAEAHRMGLVQEVVAAEKLEEFTRAFAARIAANPAIAVQAVKHLMRMAENTSLDAGLAIENNLFAYCLTTKDAAEGIAAFIEKRVPRFRGE